MPAETGLVSCASGDPVHLHARKAEEGMEEEGRGGDGEKRMGERTEIHFSFFSFFFPLGLGDIAWTRTHGL